MFDRTNLLIKRVQSLKATQTERKELDNQLNLVFAGTIETVWGATQNNPTLLPHVKVDMAKQLFKSSTLSKKIWFYKNMSQVFFI